MVRRQNFNMRLNHVDFFSKVTISAHVYLFISKNKVIWRDLTKVSSTFHSRVPSQTLSRPRFEPPISCTAGGRSTKELCEQLIQLQLETSTLAYLTNAGAICKNICSLTIGRNGIVYKQFTHCSVNDTSCVR